MTTTPFTCEQFDAVFADLLEDALPAETRAAAEAHAAGCARCRGLYGDLKEISGDAARLPVLKPSHDLWDGIAKRIETPEIALHPAPRVWQQPAWLAAAAVVLVGATAGVTWSVARHTAVQVAPAPATGVTASVAVRSASDAVARSYDADITQLRTLIADRRPALDTSTARILDASMRDIDNAIARVRSALDASPSNVQLSQQLARAYDMKVSTLKLIAALETE